MAPKQLGYSRLVAERRLHAFKSRLKQELKDHYHYFMRKSKGLDHRDPVNSQEGKKHATLYQSSSLQGNKFHNNARITMESNNWSAASQEQHHTGETNKLHSEYKTNGASHYSINIWSSRTAQYSCHCIRYFYRNCGKTNYNEMNYLQLICNKNGISCCRLFLNCHNWR